MRSIKKKVNEYKGRGGWKLEEQNQDGKYVGEINPEHHHFRKEADVITS